ncbi:MAG: polyprenyl synthetase family protein [Chitinivibrionales bacterium]|nr:polyprenyl synthetase family protein [Chitinivibrionales bacterium]MBD3355946.1 polyprenyl synthetase family protein [Chitinivibrionales bacterium]
MTNVEGYLKKAAKLVDETIEELLPPASMHPSSVHTAMRYSMFAGGKRVRPCLIMAAHEACGGEFGDRNIALASAAVEMLHTFSLVHDDLPCMDDDDFRRGKPTAHKAFSEALAVLEGDALCIYAFEVLARTGRIAVITELAQALGTGGMIGGQVVDIESEGRGVDFKTVEYIHENKTAAFIRACVRVGGMLAGAPTSTLNSLTAYGNHVGLAFQVIDDILDEEGTTEQLGKDAGSDREKGKATFPAVFGLDESKKYAQELIDAACRDVAFLGVRGDILTALADYIRTRIS